VKGFFYVKNAGRAEVDENRKRYPLLAFFVFNLKDDI